MSGLKYGRRGQTIPAQFQAGTRAESAPGERRRAALYVAERARDVADRRLLLDAFGLLDVPRRTRRPGRPRGPEHGNGGYARGCRCEVCREANRARVAEQRSRRGQASADKAGHGNPSTYKNHGCRCEPCTTAHSAAHAAYLKRRRVKDPGKYAGHGNANTYKNGCRCGPCTAAEAAWQADYHAKRRAARPPKPEAWHGTRGGYQYHRCRCGACTQAQRSYRRQYNARRAAEAVTS